MKIIAGCIIEKDNKILMVKEAKKKCYGQWNFPAGHEENIKFNESEILDVKWIDIEDIKNMKEEELRGYNMSLKFLDDYEKNHIYPVEIFE